MDQSVMNAAEWYYVGDDSLLVDAFTQTPPVVADAVTSTGSAAAAAAAAVFGESGASATAVAATPAALHHPPEPPLGPPPGLAGNDATVSLLSSSISPLAFAALAGVVGLSVGVLLARRGGRSSQATAPPPPPPQAPPVAKETASPVPVETPVVTPVVTPVATPVATPVPLVAGEPLPAALAIPFAEILAAESRVERPKPQPPPPVPPPVPPQQPAFASWSASTLPGVALPGQARADLLVWPAVLLVGLLMNRCIWRVSRLCQKVAPAPEVVRSATRTKNTTIPLEGDGRTAVPAMTTQTAATPTNKETLELSTAGGVPAAPAPEVEGTAPSAGVLEGVQFSPPSLVAWVAKPTTKAARNTVMSEYLAMQRDIKAARNSVILEHFAEQQRAVERTSAPEQQRCDERCDERSADVNMEVLLRQSTRLLGYKPRRAPESPTLAAEGIFRILPKA